MSEQRFTELEQRLKTQETLLEQWYPGWIRELAERLYEDEQMVEAKIAYMVQVSNESKYTIAYTLLTYHRLGHSMIEMGDKQNNLP